MPFPMRSLISGIVLMSSVSFAAQASSDGSGVRNVIMLIPDGTSPEALTLARWYAGGRPLALDPLMCGQVRTHAADAPVTDSAPAATAMATGYKSHGGYVSVMPREAPLWANGPSLPPNSDGTPVASVLEAARLKGLRVGLVVTSQLAHATPAAFSAHHRDRNAMDALTEQQVYADLDVALGGGLNFLLPERRKDKENLFRALEEQGFRVVTSAAELRRLEPGGKVWGAFAPEDIANDLERDNEKQPSLAEMTRFALESLSQEKKGFFLMVEGSKIDWAAHDNDPFSVVSEALGFDKAVAVALDFAKKDGNTAIVIAPDHTTGGLSLNNMAKGYDTAPLDKFIAPLKRVKAGVRTVAPLILAGRDRAGQIIAEKLGIEDLSPEDMQAVANANADSLPFVLARLVSNRASLGWATLGHSGEDVPLYMYHPRNDILRGTVDNTDLARYVARQLGLDLGAVSERLFVEVGPWLERVRGRGAWDRANAENPVFRATVGKRSLALFVNKNFAEVDGRRIVLPGVTVADGDRLWAPREAFSAQ